jgi:hypothetical protein
MKGWSRRKLFHSPFLRLDFTRWTKALGPCPACDVSCHSGVSDYQSQMYAKILFLCIGFSPTWFLKLSCQQFQAKQMGESFLISYINSFQCFARYHVESRAHFMLRWLTWTTGSKVPGFFGTYYIRLPVVLKTSTCPMHSRPSRNYIY